MRDLVSRTRETVSAILGRRDAAPTQPFSTLVMYGKPGAFVNAVAQAQVILKLTVGSDLDEASLRAPEIPFALKALARTCSNRFSVFQAGSHDVLIYRPDGVVDLKEEVDNYLVECLELIGPIAQFGAVLRCGDGSSPVAVAAEGMPDDTMPVVVLGLAKLKDDAFFVDSALPVSKGASSGALGYVGNEVVFFGIADSKSTALSATEAARRGFVKSVPLHPMKADGLVVDPARNAVSTAEGDEVRMVGGYTQGFLPLGPS